MGLRTDGLEREKTADGWEARQSARRHASTSTSLMHSSNPSAPFGRKVLATGSLAASTAVRLPGQLIS